MQKTYPDISDILAAKAQRRLALAALPWEEKVAIIERMRVLLPGDMWRDGPAEGGGSGQGPNGQRQSWRG